MQVFDIHAHIYPDPIAERAVGALRSAYDGVEVLNDGRLPTLMDLLKRAGIQRCAVHSVATTPHQVESINRFVMEASRAHPGSIVPFAAMHPDMPEPEEAVDALVAAGFRGVKLHPEFQGFRVDDARAMRLFGALAGKLPVLLHCGDYRVDNSAPERIRNMVRQLPELTLVCAHLGGWTKWEQAAQVLTGTGVWVDTSSSLYGLKDETAAEIIRGYGVDRVLFGSDYPVWTPGEELALFLKLPLTEEEREKILWSNHLKLFGDNI